MEPLEADCNAVLSPLSPGEALLNAAPCDTSESQQRVWFATPLTQSAGPASRPHSPARRKRKSSISSQQSFPDFLQGLLRDGDGTRESDGEGRLAKVLRENCPSLSDCSWPASPRSCGFTTDGEVPPGSRSLAHSSGDERSERPGQARPPTMKIVQRPKGNVFRKDTRLMTPYVVEIGLPRGSRPASDVSALMITDAGRSSLVLSSVKPQFSSAFSGDSSSSFTIQLFATFDNLRLHTGSHNNPAYIFFEMSYMDAAGATQKLSSPPSEPFIVCTHSSQLISAAVQLLRFSAFRLETVLPWSRFSVTLREHFNEATLLTRSLSNSDLEYLHERIGTPSFVTIKDVTTLCDWLGNVMKVLMQRRGRHLWDSGLLVGLLPVERVIKHVTPGTAVFGFHPGTGNLVAHITPFGCGGLGRTCSASARQSIVDLVLDDMLVDRVWHATQRTAIPKTQAETLAGLTRRRMKSAKNKDGSDSE